MSRSPSPYFAYFVRQTSIAFAAFMAGVGARMAGAPVDFVLFGLTLTGVALFHRHTLAVALSGLAAITLYKLFYSRFQAGPGFAGLGGHLAHEWVILVNLFALLTGFALLARHFEESQLPALLPRFLPDGWKGALCLLVIVFMLSSFLDNIAGAIIGATMAGAVYRHKVHIGFLAAIVAASNAGGAGSVIGDTTTTMMWLDGVSPLAVLNAYVAAVTALVVCAIPAARQQQRHASIDRDVAAQLRVDWARVGIVVFILTVAIVANVIVNLYAPELAEQIPVIGLGVWTAILATAAVRRPDWTIMPSAAKGGIFLLALVTSASMMPVEELPSASWQTTLGLGFLSSVFDNIPLTALALKQGGYDWGMLAFAVGFGGSMTWFGSSAGVAVAGMFQEAKSVGRWLLDGWHVVVGYVAGFIVMLMFMGWHPTETRHSQAPSETTSADMPAR